MILTKSFSKEHENQFLKSEQFTSPQYIRGIFVMFIFFYGLFFLVDLAYFPDEINLLIFIRFGLVIPILLSTIVLTFTKYFYKFNQQMVALSFFVGGSGVAYMLVLQPDNIVYNGGLFIVI
ncbi:MAG: hypothetical protein RBT45_08200, partial [Acholeplasmataceae bacterium]|nr:hypothetical protein [Acholeplasmataceae bacterium]